MADSSLTVLQSRLTSTVMGSEKASRLMVSALLAGGHILIEGAPGIGKTTLAHTLAGLMGGVFRRVQFTPDLSPADLLGCSLYRMDRGEFEFIPGPVFANCLLADEINRASPRVQSALLECMNEGCVTLDGVTRGLPDPFMVIATRNDTDDVGTFPLPEPQLDRFLVSVQMELPMPEVQRDILLAHARGGISSTLDHPPFSSPEEMVRLRGEASRVAVSRELAEYITALCESLRRTAVSSARVSVRASLAILRAARAVAYLDGESAVFPDHVQEVFPAVMRHRIGSLDGDDGAEMIRDALKQTRVV